MDQVSYDHILIATSYLETDRRMHRICSALAEEGSVLLVGRGEFSQDVDFDTTSYNCVMSSGPLFYAEILMRLMILMRRYQWRTLTCVDSDTLLVGRWYRLFRSFEWYHDAHEYFAEVPELSGRPIKKWIWHTIAKICIPKTDHRYTVGPALAEELSTVYRSDFEVIRNVPERRGSSLSPDIAKPKNKTILVYLGVLNVGRGLPELLSAMDLLPDHELWLIGDGDIADQLQSQNQSMCHPERIVFLGQLSEEQFFPILRQADIGVNLLSDCSRSYYYSLANKFFDYLHAGLPVLTMNFPEYQHIIHQHSCGVCIDDLNVETVVAGIQKIEDMDQRRLMEGMERAMESFEWKKEKEKLKELYKK